jgi:hypothetical protein
MFSLETVVLENTSIVQPTQHAVQAVEKAHIIHNYNILGTKEKVLSSNRKIITCTFATYYDCERTTLAESASSN